MSTYSHHKKPRRERGFCVSGHQCPAQLAVANALERAIPSRDLKIEPELADAVAEAELHLHSFDLPGA